MRHAQVRTPLLASSHYYGNIIIQRHCVHLGDCGVQVEGNVSLQTGASSGKQPPLEREIPSPHHLQHLRI